jgi:hypothetical protein
LADATGWIGQGGTKSWKEEDGEENQKKGIKKRLWGRKRNKEKNRFKPPALEHFYNTAGK